MNNFIDIPDRSQIPFPQLTDIVPSPKTVEVLKDLCYDRFSELTALTTYLYQDWAWYPNYQDIANIMEKIAIVEMTHLDALSNAIVAFGGKADYNKNGKYWTSASLSFNLSLPETMYQNIATEEGAIASYQEAIKIVDNLSLKKLFEKIIADEEQHIAIFEAIIAYLEKGV